MNSKVLTADFLPELRSGLGQGLKGYRDGEALFLKKAAEWGWGGATGDQIIWTDAFHPGFFLNIDQPQTGPISRYARVENFSTGEVWAQWHSKDGDFKRKLFVSRPDNTIVSTTSGPAGKVSLSLTLQPVTSPLITSTTTFSDGWILTHNVYVKGKGGFDCASRIISDGGSQTSDGESITITPCRFGDRAFTHCGLAISASGKRGMAQQPEKSRLCKGAPRR